MARVVDFEPRATAGERRAVVASWHERARQLGLQEGLQPDFASVSLAELARLAERHHALFTHAVPVMEMLHQQIRNTHSMVILTDADGLILHTMGDADFLERADRVALRAGVLWAEPSKGTNAIGTALTEARPTLVHGSEHFLAVNRFLTCSCSPIRDPHGRLLGALDVSGAKQSYHAHTMALVRMSTQMIENHLFVDRFSQTVRIHFHLRAEFLGTLAEGIAAFDEAGRFIAANPAGLLQLGLPAETLRDHTLATLFDTTLGALMDRSRREGAAPLSLCLANGVKVSARMELCAPALRLRPVGAAAAVRHRALALSELDLGEPAIGRIIEQVRRVQHHEIPIVICGETGTGKEVLARAIHNESPRGGKPFVAVDCASIPESLIEAELFGYEEGAFTGARRRGNSGKILMAHGGTLFLDEIGDMPGALQSRLLRVLQERTVTPLGSGKTLAVDIAVICATHRNLREMLQHGTFREDLYYRLNGLVVRLPPLRERGDLVPLMRRVLEEVDAGAASIAPEVLQLFRRFRWPGNLRQLANVLRTAAAMAGGRGIIGVHHLPDDFLEELRAAAPGAAAAAGARAGDGGAPHAQPAYARNASLRQVRAAAIREALEQHGGNVAAAARHLKVSRNTVYRALRAART